MSIDSIIFDNKKFADLLKEIYSNQRKKDRQINLLIADLKPYITSISDAAQLVPIIRDYMDISIKNDDHLIKMAAIIQRMVSNKSTDGGSSDSLLSDEEKEELLKGFERVAKEMEEDNKNLGNIHVPKPTENNT